MILHIARLAPLLAAILCWRVSRPAAVALLVAFAASLVYLAAPLEPLRWVSALVGLVGAVEFGRVANLAVRVAKINRGNVVLRMLHLEARVGAANAKRGAIGVLLFASAAGDGAAYIAWIRLDEWVMPAAQIVVCVAIAAIARWPERRKT